MAYSNAVLAAILPHISDYAKKLDLPIPQPITASQVAHFGVANLQGDLGGGVWLTNNYWFVFANGYVDSFRLNKHNPFIDDDPAENWPKYAFGKINMTTNEAIDFARQSVVKLGYDVKALHIDIPPESFSGGVILNDGNPFPYCEMSWDHEVEITNGVNNSINVEAQVNMNNKSLIGLSIIGRIAWQTNPPIAVVPELESDYQKRTQGQFHPASP